MDKPIILTLDAGGTNFVFSAICGGVGIGKEVHLKAVTSDEVNCTRTIIKGFELLKEQVQDTISCISFAFPGPADYKNGIIGDLPNFSGIKGNYPLKALLENHFKLPVYINNDGDLFAYGESLGGVLPEINQLLEQAGNPKRFNNLIGITLGTGFGCGIVINRALLRGDNSCGAEIHNLGNINNPNWSIEESVSTRAILRVYEEQASVKIDKSWKPKDIYEIAKGKKEGNQKAAIHSFHEYGVAIGRALVDVITLIDGLVVIGGGITAAWDLIAPGLFELLKSNYTRPDGVKTPRTTVKIFDMEIKSDFEEFIKGKIKKIYVASLETEIIHDSLPRTGIILSRNGANKSAFLGAYYYAMSQLKN